MKAIIEITTANGQFYYDLFYFLAIAFAGVFFLIDGKRKKYPLVEWTLIFSSGIIFLIIGTKLFAYTPNEWKEIVSSFTFPYIERKTILGGIVGGIIGIWFAKKFIRFPNPVLDSFAVSFPIAMAIQRIGCFMAGCCFGTPTNVPWAVTYSYHALPYFVHLNNGLIDDTSCMSLPIHPNQLYQTLLCLLIAFIVWKLKDKIKRPGNLFFTSIALYWIARFIVEFWREGVSNGIAGNIWMGLKYLQWGLLGAILLMGLFIFIREKKYILALIIIPSLCNPVWYFIALSVFVLMLSNWFTKTEFLFIVLVLLPTTILHLNKILRQDHRGFRFRLVSLYVLLFILVFFGVLAAQKTYRQLTKDDISSNRFNDISLGYGNLQYSHYHSPPDKITVPLSTGCNPSPGYTYYQAKGPLFLHNSNVLGIGYTYTETFGKFRKISLAGHISGGFDTDNDKNQKNTIKTFDIVPSVKFDTRWFGVGLGFHIGEHLTELETENILYSTDNTPRMYAILSGSLRLFPYDIFYAEVRYNDMFPYQIGHRTSKATQLLLGSGLGFKNGNGLEYGYDGNGGSFFSAKAWFLNRVGIKASIYSYKGDYINQMIQFSVSYRFSQKHWINTRLKKD